MRYLLVSDIHGNLQAFEAVLQDAPPGLPVWCLGDLVGYGPNPNECIELLQSLDHECIVGNHDWAAMNKVDLNDFNPDAKQAVQWTQEQLTPASVAYLESLPATLVKGAFTLVHGSPREPIWEYILYPPIACTNFAYLETPHCLVGHTHVPIKFHPGRQQRTGVRDGTASGGWRAAAGHETRDHQPGQRRTAPRRRRTRQLRDPGHRSLDSGAQARAL